MEHSLWRLCGFQVGEHAAYGGLVWLAASQEVEVGPWEQRSHERLAESVGRARCGLEVACPRDRPWTWVTDAREEAGQGPRLLWTSFTL